MTQKYVFEIVLDDSGDEFSETFNPTDTEEVANFEKSIEQLFSDHGWISTVSLKRVTVDL